LVKLIQSFQRAVDVEKLGRLLNGQGHGVLQRDDDLIPAALFGIGCARVVDQNPTHYLYSHSEEVRSVLRTPLSPLDEA
jgi:hypothetical protein